MSEPKKKASTPRKATKAPAATKKPAARKKPVARKATTRARKPVVQVVETVESLEAQRAAIDALLERQYAAERPYEAPAPVVYRAEPVDRIIRNLRTVPVHLRLGSTRDPYRVQLQPRGAAGDYDTIPAAFIGQLKDVGILYEFVTETERRGLEYGKANYPVRETATILREEDTVIMRQEDWDGKGRMPERDSHGHAIHPNARRDTGAGPAYANVPGSNQALHAGLAEGSREQGRPDADAMLPPGAGFDRSRVTVEHTRGQ